MLHAYVKHVKAKITKQCRIGDEIPFIPFYVYRHKYINGYV